MSDDDKTKEQFISELQLLRDQLEAANSRYKLREEELDLKAQLLDNAADSIFLRDLDGKHIYFNRAAYQSRGYSKEEMMKMNLSQIIDPVHSESLAEKNKELKEKGQAQWESVHIRKDGSLMTVGVNSRILKIGDKEYVLSILRDITEYKKVERELRESEDKFKNLIDNSPLGIAIATTDGQIIEANDALVNLFGYSSKEEYMRVPAIENYWDKKDRDIFIKKLKKGVVKDLEVRGKTKNGSMIWYAISSIAQTGDDGTPRHISYFMDITERKQTEYRINILHSLSEALTADLQLKYVLKICIEAVLEITTMDCGAGYLIDPETGAVDLVYQRGLSDQFAKKASHFEADSVFARFIGAGKSVYRIEKGLGQTFIKLLKSEGFSNIVIAPVKYGNNVMACFYLASRSSNGMAMYLRNVVDSVSTRASQAIIRIKSKEALQESEERLRNIVEGARECIIVNDYKGNILIANDYTSEITGYSKEELLSLKISDINPQASRDYAMWGNLKDGKEHVFETIHRRKDGSLFPVQVKLTQVMFGGHPVVLGFSSDITERKRNEERTLIQRDLATALTAELTLDEALMICVETAIAVTETTCGGIYLVDQELDSLDLAFQKGLPDEFIKEASHFKPNSILARRVKKGNPIYSINKKFDPVIISLTERNGLLTNAFVPIVHGDRVIGSLFVSSNVSGDFNDRARSILESLGARAANVITRIRSEEALKYREELERLISSISTEFTNLDSGEVNQGIDRALKLVGEFCGADRSCIFLFSNDLKMLHMTNEWCAEGIEPMISLHQNEPISDFPLLVKVLKTEEAIVIPRVSDLSPQYNKPKKEFQLFEIKSLVLVPMISKRAVVGCIKLDSVRKGKKWTDEVVVLLRVIGENIANALERKWADEERAAILEDLRITNDKLGESNKELVDFAYIASHDLREPLRKITSFGGLLQESLTGKLDDDEKENFQFMIDGAKRMQDMIEDLLNYSRITIKAKSFEKVDLNQVIDELKSLELAMLIEDNNGIISVPEPLPFVYGDPSQLRQLLQNLIGNGLKFHRKGVVPEVVVRSGRIKDGMVRIEVQDNGIGIPEDYYDQIFSMFKRLHSIDKYEGTGIGLAVCRKIVARHGGEIGVKSTPEYGTTFWFTIPERA